MCQLEENVEVGEAEEEEDLVVFWIQQPSTIGHSLRRERLTRARGRVVQVRIETTN